MRVLDEVFTIKEAADLWEKSPVSIKQLCTFKFYCSNN